MNNLSRAKLEENKQKLVLFIFAIVFVLLGFVAFFLGGARHVYGIFERVELLEISEKITKEDIKEIKEDVSNIETKLQIVNETITRTDNRTDDMEETIDEILNDVRKRKR